MVTSMFTLLLLACQAYACLCYWEDICPGSKETIINSAEVSPLIKSFYLQEWQITDDNRTFVLLEDLVSPPSEKVRPLYFHLFNEVCSVADGAVAEIIGKYSIKIIENNRDYVLPYLYKTKNKDLLQQYAFHIGYELWVNGDKQQINTFSSLILSGPEGGSAFLEGINKTIMQFGDE